MVQFAGDVTIPIREPTENFDEVWTAVNAITDQGDGPSMTFAAIKQAADEYLPFRKKHAWHVIFVVVSDKPGALGNGDGSPSQQIDSLAERFQTSAVPVFVIGASVPFSTQAAQSLSGGATRGQPSAKSGAPGRVRLPAVGSDRSGVRRRRE